MQASIRCEKTTTGWCWQVLVTDDAGKEYKRTGTAVDRRDVTNAAENAAWFLKEEIQGPQVIEYTMELL